VEQARERLIAQIKDDWQSELGALAQVLLMRFE
jgi:hypothetical protein